MIKIGTTGGAVKHTGRVGLENGAVSLDGDGKRLLSEGGLHGRDVASGDVGVRGSTSDTLSGIEGASSGGQSFTTGVWVIGVRFQGVLLGVSEGVALVTTIAAVVTPEGGTSAGNELLLRKADEGAGFNLVSTFQGTSGGEGPA